MFGLIGPDGAGKTTAIRLICGLMHPDGGQVRVLGLDPATDHRAITHKVGYLSQRFSLYGDLTVDENISFFAAIHGVDDYQQRRNHLLDMTQLTPFRGRLADKLSGGMKQKLALACTLVHQPDLVLLDEPTTGVDPVSRREFWKLLSHFLESGITILMSTPYLDEAERCTRVALVHNGQLLALDRPGALRTSLPGLWLEGFPPSVRDVRDRLRAAGHAARRGVRRTAARVAAHRDERRGRATAASGAHRAGRRAALRRPDHHADARRRVHRPARRARPRARRRGGSPVMTVLSPPRSRLHRPRAAGAARTAQILVIAAAVLSAAPTALPDPGAAADHLGRGAGPGHGDEPSAGRGPRPPAERRSHRRGPTQGRRPDGDRAGRLHAHQSRRGVRLPQLGTGVRVIYPDIPDNFRTRLELAWPVYTAGRVDALARAAQAEATASGLDLETTRLDLRLEVARAYWALVTAREAVRVLEAGLATADRSLVDVRNRVEAGLLPPNDVTRSESQRARQELLLIEARGRIETTSLDLRRLIGERDTTPIEPADALDLPSSEDGETQALITEALAQRPELGALTARADGVDARIEAIAAQRAARRGGRVGRRLRASQSAHLPAPAHLRGVVGRLAQSELAVLGLGPRCRRADRGAVPGAVDPRAPRRRGNTGARRRAEAARRAGLGAGRAGPGPPGRYRRTGNQPRARRSVRGRRRHHASTSSTPRCRCSRPSSIAPGCWPRSSSAKRAWRGCWGDSVTPRQPAAASPQPGPDPGPIEPRTPLPSPSTCST